MVLMVRYPSIWLHPLVRSQPTTVLEIRYNLAEGKESVRFGVKVNDWDLLSDVPHVFCHTQGHFAVLCSPLQLQLLHTE